MSAGRTGMSVAVRETLGVVREVSWDGDACVVVITPTYSGCPAMREITQDIERTLARHGIAEVWLLDVTGRGLTVYRAPGPGGYAEQRRIGDAGPLAPIMLPAAVIDLTGLL